MITSMITNPGLHAEIQGKFKTDRSPKTRIGIGFRTLRFTAGHSAYHTGSVGSQLNMDLSSAFRASLLGKLCHKLFVSWLHR